MCIPGYFDFSHLTHVLSFLTQGRMRELTNEERPAQRDAFLAKYPTAFWVDFADFKWLVMEELSAIRFNGGFGMAGKVSCRTLSSGI